MITQIQAMNSANDSAKQTKVEAKAPVSNDNQRRDLNSGFAVVTVTSKIINKETGKVMSVSKPTPITEEVVMPAGYEISSIVYNGKTYNDIKDVKISGESGEVTYYVVPVKNNAGTTTTTTTKTETTTTTTTTVPSKLTFNIKIVDESGKELSKNTITESTSDKISLPTIKLPDGYQLSKETVNGQEIKNGEFKAPTDLTKPIEIVITAKKAPVVPATPEKPADKPADKPTTPAKPEEKPVDKDNTIKPADKPTTPAKTEDKPTTPAKPEEKPVDKDNTSKPADKPADTTANKPVDKDQSKDTSTDKKDTSTDKKDDTFKPSGDKGATDKKDDTFKPGDKQDASKDQNKDTSKDQNKEKTEAEKTADTLAWLKKMGIPEDAINKMKGYQPSEIQAHPFDTKVIKKGQNVPEGFIPVKVDGDNVYLESKQGSISWKSPASVQVETVKSGIENLGNCHYKLTFANTNKPVDLKAPVSTEDGKDTPVKDTPKTQKIDNVDTLGQLGIPDAVVKTLKDLKATDIVLTEYNQVKLSSKEKAPVGMIPVAQHGDLITYESSQGKVAFKVPAGTKVPENIKADKDGVYSITFDNPAKQIEVKATDKDKENQTSNITVEVIENGKDESYFKTYSGIVGTKANILNPVQQGYKVMYITVDGKKVKDVPTTFGDKDMKVVYHVSNESRKIKVQVINPSNQVVSTQEVSGLIDSEISPSSIKLPAGYRLSTLIQNGKVVDKLTVGTEDGEAKLMIVPTTQSTVTLHYMYDGKEIQDPYIIVGTQGQKVGLSSNDIPSGYKVTGITINGKPVKAIPDKFDKDNWDVVLQLKPLTEKEKEEAKKKAEENKKPTDMADGKESTNTTGKQEQHKNGETVSEAIEKANKAAANASTKKDSNSTEATATKAEGASTEGASTEGASTTATADNATAESVSNGKGLEDTGISVDSQANGVTVAVETSIALAAGLFMGLIASKRGKGRVSL